MSLSSYCGTVQCARTSSVVLLFVSFHTTEMLNRAMELKNWLWTQMAKIKTTKTKKQKNSLRAFRLSLKIRLSYRKKTEKEREREIR